jgi:phenol hydroxylase P4 protein
MPVSSVGEYIGVPRDVEANYHGNRLLYVTWERHLLFAAPLIFPVPPSMRFGDFASGMLAGVIAIHPDAARIDWSACRWMKNGEPWVPDPGRSMDDNGVRHKDALMLQTPGLDGLNGAGF